MRLHRQWMSVAATWGMLGGILGWMPGTIPVARAEQLPVPDPFMLTNPSAVVPGLTLRGADDARVELAAWRGRFVLLSFWATWCAPCIEEMPSLDNLERDLGGRRFQVVPVSVEGRTRLVKVDAFMHAYRLSNLPVYALEQKTDQRAFGVRAIPTTLLIDPDGKEIWRALGTVDWDSAAARAMITHYLDAAP